ncbi:MAG: GNAT family N-acetyltransferase [Dehalococcoidia bacterium]
MVNEVARGNKVVLRDKVIEDVDDDHRWRQDPELAELDATVVLKQSYKDYKRDYENELRYPTPWVHRYGVDTHDGVHIGNCMVYDIDTVAGQCELGILLGNRDYWNDGYGREAMVLLMDECFKTLSMKRLYLHTLSWNARARRAFVGCGFREVGPDRRGGKDFILMEISREEWLTSGEQLPALETRGGAPD